MFLKNFKYSASHHRHLLKFLNDIATSPRLKRSYVAHSKYFFKQIM